MFQIVQVFEVLVNHSFNRPFNRW